MSKVIEGIPESFTREQYVSLFDAVGMNPYDVKSLEFRAEGVYAVVFDKNEDGARYLDAHGSDGELAKHRVFIPVDGGLPERKAFKAVADLKAVSA